MINKKNFSLSILASLAITFSSYANDFTPPSSPQKPVVENLHGVTLTDSYKWLEDKENPEVKEWTKKQHESTINYLNEKEPEIKGLKDEIRNLIDRDRESPLKLVGKHKFITKKKKGEPQYKLYTIINNKEFLLFDPTKLDPSGKTAITDIEYTFSGNKVAIGVQLKGDEINTYYILDTTTGKEISKPIQNLRGFNWTKDEKNAYITVGSKEMLEKQIPLKTYLHDTTKNVPDTFLMAPKDAKNFASIYDSKDSDFTFITEGDFYSNSIKIKKIGSKQDKLIYTNQGFSAHPYAIGNKIYIQTNHKAPNYKIMLADAKNPDFKNWKTLYSEKNTVLENFEVTENNLLVVDKKDLISRLFIYTLDGKLLKEVKLPEIGSISNLNYDRENKKLFVGLSSFTSTYKLYTLDTKNFDKWNLYYQVKEPVDTKDITAKIEFIPSKDGTKVPAFIIHKKGLKLDGNNPTLLYGYGGFNAGISPSYVGYYASFINRGGIFVNAGIRGGDEYGEKWHQDGMLFKKQNTFDDFISVAEYLQKKKYTSSKKLAIMGGSNGGLLIGAVLTQRPDLFRAAVCSVPLLDMVHFHKFLIARYWIPEYGNPEKEADFRNILTYSPYHKIRQGINLPITLFQAGENDTRVASLHPKKFVAALQNNIGQVSPMMLYVDFESGHGSGKSTEKVVEDQNYLWRFLMNELGMK
ncbi:MAG: prolyl oligopeptidase family serine peptidase [Candidatus Sericytochromatia bacterium]